jgi:hypothetical protein
MPGKMRSVSALLRSNNLKDRTIHRQQLKIARLTSALQFCRFPFTDRAPNGHRNLSDLCRILLISQTNEQNLPTPKDMHSLLSSLNLNYKVRNSAGHGDAGPDPGLSEASGIETEAKTRD